MKAEGETQHRNESGSRICRLHFQVSLAAGSKAYPRMKPLPANIVSEAIQEYLEAEIEATEGADLRAIEAGV